MTNGNVSSSRFSLSFAKRTYAVGLVLLLSHTAYGQIFKNIGVSSGVNFTPLRWEYRYSSADPIKIRRSEKQPTAVNVYITADLMEKKIWNINSSLGWILKKGMFTERPGFSVSVPYKLNYISWINSVKGKLQIRKHFNFNVALGPRIEYLLTGWKDLPAFAPNDDAFFYYHREQDVRKFLIGLSSGVGLTWQIKKTMLQLSGWKNINFNPIISARGVRADGLGDEGFYFEMTDKAYGINVQFTFSL